MPVRVRPDILASRGGIDGTEHDMPEDRVVGTTFEISATLHDVIDLVGTGTDGTLAGWHYNWTSDSDPTAPADAAYPEIVFADGATSITGTSISVVYTVTPRQVLADPLPPAGPTITAPFAAGTVDVGGPGAVVADHAQVAHAGGPATVAITGDILLADSMQPTSVAAVVGNDTIGIGQATMAVGGGAALTFIHTASLMLFDPGTGAATPQDAGASALGADSDTLYVTGLGNHVPAAASAGNSTLTAIGWSGDTPPLHSGADVIVVNATSNVFPVSSPGNIGADVIDVFKPGTDPTALFGFAGDASVSTDQQAPTTLADTRSHMILGDGTTITFDTFTFNGDASRTLFG